MQNGITLTLHVTIDTGDDDPVTVSSADFRKEVAKNIEALFNQTENPVYYNEHTGEYYDIVKVETI